MKNKFYIIVIVFVFCLSTVIQSSVLAAETKISFNYAKTRRLLKKLSHKYNLTNAQELKVKRVVELIDYLQFLQSRVYQLVATNNELKDFITTHKRASKSILKSVNTIELETEIEPEDIIVDWHLDKVEFTQIDNELDRLLGQIVEIKAKNVENISSLQKRSEKLVKLSSKLKLKDKQKSHRTTKSPKIKKGRFNGLTDEVKYLHKAMESLRKDVQESENTINSLTGKLANQTLEVFEKENELADHVQEYNKLNNELIDTQARLNLVQRIIKDKDETINQLETYVGEIKQTNEKQDSFNRDQLEGLQAQLSTLSDKFNQQKSFNDNRLISLEELLAEQELKFAEYEMAIKEKEEVIEELSDEMVSQSKEINTLKNLMQSKNDKLLELNGIIQIYKGKLSDLREQDAVQTPDIQIGEDSLAEVQNELDDAQKVTLELYKQIINLQSKLEEEDLNFDIE